MKEFQASVRRRLRLLVWVLAVFVLVVVAVGLYGYESSGSTNSAGDFVLGLQTGIFLGTLVMIALKIRTLRAASKNETALRTLMIEEKDERKQLIEQKSNSLALNAILLLASLAAVITGFFDITISITLFAVLAVVALIMTITKQYYNRKY